MAYILGSCPPSPPAYRVQFLAKLRSAVMALLVHGGHFAKLG